MSANARFDVFNELVEASIRTRRKSCKSMAALPIVFVRTAVRDNIIVISLEVSDCCRDIIVMLLQCSLLNALSMVFDPNIGGWISHEEQQMQHYGAILFEVALGILKREEVLFELQIGQSCRIHHVAEALCHNCAVNSIVEDSFVDIIISRIDGSKRPKRRWTQIQNRHARSKFSSQTLVCLANIMLQCH
jgi:hypothetical protein